MMQESEAITLLEQQMTDETAGEVADSLLVRVAGLLAAADQRLEEGIEPAPGEAQAIKVMLKWLIRESEVIERDLIRFLRFESEADRNWQAVAEEIGDEYAGGRGSIQRRWARLKDNGRRTTTKDMRRGSAIRRKSDA